MHEQPCDTLWDVNYIPQTSHSQYFPYLVGVCILLVPITPMLMSASLHELGAMLSIAYFCTISTIA